MAKAYAIANKTGQDHPLRKAMLAEGGMKVLWLGKPLSHCAHPSHCPMLELSVQTRKQSTIFFAKLGAIYGWLNLIAKPNQIYNVDASSIKSNCSNWVA